MQEPTADGVAIKVKKKVIAAKRRKINKNIYGILIYTGILLLISSIILDHKKLFLLLDLRAGGPRGVDQRIKKY